MLNRLMAIDFNNHDCLIHVQYDHERMDIYLLDKALQEALRTKKFTIKHSGEVVSEVKLDDKLNTKALIELYDYLLAHPASMPSIAA